MNRARKTKRNLNFRESNVCCKQIIKEREWKTEKIVLNQIKEHIWRYSCRWRWWNQCRAKKIRLHNPNILFESKNTRFIHKRPRIAISAKVHSSSDKKNDDIRSLISSKESCYFLKIFKKSQVRKLKTGQNYFQKCKKSKQP